MTTTLTDRVIELEAEVAKLKEWLLRERQSYVALVTHLEGPTGWQLTEPGTYMPLVKIFTDMSGHCHEIKRITPDNSPDAPYPCREWREWRATFPRHFMPYKFEDYVPGHTGDPVSPLAPKPNKTP